MSIHAEEKCMKVGRGLHSHLIDIVPCYAINAPTCIINVSTIHATINSHKSVCKTYHSGRVNLSCRMNVHITNYSWPFITALSQKLWISGSVYFQVIAVCIYGCSKSKTQRTENNTTSEFCFVHIININTLRGRV